MLAMLRTLWPYLHPYRRTFALALAAMLGEVVTALLAPWPLKFVFDRVLLAHGHHKFVHLRMSLGPEQWLLLAIVTGVAVLIAVADAVLSYYDTQLSEVASVK